MIDVDCEAGGAYDVLLQDGEFRLVRDPQFYHECIVQHHCDNPLNTEKTYCDLEQGWHYCWAREETCTACGVEVPVPILGLKTLHHWEI